MNRKQLLMGISLAALAASGASAANTANVSNTGNGNAVSYDQTGATESTVDITVTGDDNRADVDQNGFRQDADITISGDSNSATIDQYGGYSEAAITQNGDTYSSTADISQAGSEATATITQTGANGASASIAQGSQYYGEYSSGTVVVSGAIATISQTGSGNSGSASINQQASFTEASITQSGVDSSHQAAISQGASFSTASISQSGDYSEGVSGQSFAQIAQSIGNSNEASITQTGNNQGIIRQGGYNYSYSEGTYSAAYGATATVNQSGTGNLGGVVQGFATTFDGNTFSGDNNGGVATVMQSGQGSYSVIGQNGTDNVASSTTGGSANSSYVLQDGDTSSGDATSDVAGANNLSRIYQLEGGDNSATAFVGGVTTGGANANSSRIQQSGDTNTAFASVGRTSRSSISAGVQQASSITQNGDRNNAEVTLYGGTADTNTNPNSPAQVQGLSGGNSATISQNGFSSTAFVVAGAPVVNGASTAGEGLGNSSTVTQTNNFDVAAGRGASATVWQQGRYGRTSITQAVNGDAAHGYTNGAAARPLAGVFQSGLAFSATVNQTGDGNVDITQGRGFNGRITVTQVDAGDGSSTTTTPGTTTTTTDANGFPVTTTTPGTTTTNFVRELNTATLVQYGTSNVATVNQNTRNGNATVFQKENSTGNDAGVEQGTGATATTSFSPAPTVLTGSPSTGANSNTLVASVTQSGTNNGTRVRQDGARLTATVSQAGTGNAALDANSFAGNYGAAHNGNIVQISQQGSDNTATATQTANVGASTGTAPASGQAGDTYYFSGGARSPEIDILQGGSFNTATAEQRGKGQYARIEQGGDHNSASILQGESALNATAVITQTGSNNTYSVTQNQAGQYVQVTQSGNSNAATTIVQRGPL